MLEYLHNLQDAEFLRPAFLWLLLPVLILPFLALWRGRGYTKLIRCLGLALVILALADPAVKKTKSREEIVALFDVSKSVSARAQKTLLNALRSFAGGDADLVINLVPFAKTSANEPIIVTAESSESSIRSALEKAAASLDTGETNIGAALSRVAGRGEDAAVLLLSDGFETAGNARQAAKLALANGARIYPLIPNEAAFSDEDLSLSLLQAPLTVNEGDLTQVRTAVKNALKTPASATLELWLDQKKLLSREVAVPPGEERLVMVKTPPNEGGLHRLRAVLRSGENAATERELHRWISAKNKSKLLLLSGTADDQRVLRQLLSLKGYSLQDIVADGNTEIPVMFDDFSGVIMNNVAERQLPKRFLEELRKYVQSGGGLLLVGGDRSFGLGGYINTTLEELSPLKFVPPQTTKRRLNSAIMLVIDKSRSMAFEGKLEGAKAGALLAIQSMKNDDYVGVVGFDSAPFVIIRLSPVPEVKEMAERRLAHLTAAKKTDLLPALAVARQSLEKAPASRKHIIVLSDGKVPVAGNEYVDEMNRLRAEGITLSTVALGIEADAPFMQMLSQYGRGAFYHTMEPSRVPQIFVHDIKVSTGEKTMKERSDYPVALGPAGVVSTAVETYPAVRGYVQTLPKRGANIELITRDDEAVHPLLASWSFGMGKVVAFTSDANGRWSLPWLNWIGFPKFWSELIQTIEHTPEAKAGQVDFDLRYAVNRKTLHLDLAVFDEKLRNESSPRVSADVILPGGETRSVSFLPEKKGRFTANIENVRPGDVRLNISYGPVKMPPLAMSLPGDLFGEAPGRGIDVQNLSDLAFLSGGSINPAPGQVASAKRLSKTYTRLYVPLVMAAFFLIMLEAFLRELGLRFLFRPVRLWRRNVQIARGIYQPRKAASEQA